MKKCLISICALSAMTIAGCPNGAGNDGSDPTTGGSTGTGGSNNNGGSTGNSGQTDPPPTIQIDDEEKLFIAALAGIGDKTRSAANDMTGFIVAAVFEASAQSGVFATTGTMTQIASGVQQFAYSASPSDRLIVMFTNGDRIEFAISAFDGSLESVPAFIDFHADLDFTAKADGQFDLRVQSTSGDPDGIGGVNSEFDNRISGTMTLDGGDVRVDLTHLGTTSVDAASGQLLTIERITGNARASDGSISVDESFEFGSLGTVVQFRSRRISTGNRDGADYRLQDVIIQKETTAGVVAQPLIWQAGGTVFKDEQSVGEVQFDGPAMLGAAGPGVILRLASGDDIEL